MKRKSDTAHWLSGATERCDHCGQFYVYEMEYRCTACDGPVCPLCVHSEWKADVHCPTCAGRASGKSS